MKRLLKLTGLADARPALATAVWAHGDEGSDDVDAPDVWTTVLVLSSD